MTPVANLNNMRLQTPKVNLMAKIYIYVSSTTQRWPNKIIKIFWLKIFSICHRCRWHRWQTLSCEYLRKFLKKFETFLIGYSGAGGKLIHEKNQKQKISWHCPFNHTSLKSIPMWSNKSIRLISSSLYRTPLVSSPLYSSPLQSSQLHNTQLIRSTCNSSLLYSTHPTDKQPTAEQHPTQHPTDQQLMDQ